MISASFPSLLQCFFADHLLRQRQASPHTVAGYRDCFRLLLQFAKERLGQSPSQLRIEDLDAPFIGHFLDHLESTRKNCPRTRNARLGAIHSFFRYVALEEPALGLHCQRILAVPNKRHVRRPIDFLNREEMDTLLAVPDSSTWMGRRDRTLVLVALQTGLRVSELIGLNCQDVILGTGAHVRCLGKGRKQRCTPLRPETAKMLKAWLRERHGQPEDPLFPSIRGTRFSPRCDRAPHHQVRPSCGTDLPVAQAEARLPACTASRRSHGPSSPWRRSYRDRALAGARIRGDNKDVSPCRHALEGESPLAHCAARNQTRAIPPS